MGKKIRFQVGPPNCFSSREAARNFSEAFIEKIAAVGELGLDVGDLRVMWPPGRSDFIEIELIFLFDDPDWVNSNLGLLGETIISIFRAEPNINERYSSLRIKCEGMNGSKKPQVQVFPLIEDRNTSLSEEETEEMAVVSLIDSGEDD